MELLLLLCFASISSIGAGGVFVGKEEASQFLRLHRVARSNRADIFEEWKPGNTERECIEEDCNYEEAFEVSDDNNIAQSFWIKYQACNKRVFAPKRRGRGATPQDQIDRLRLCLADVNQCEPGPCVGDNTMVCNDLFGDFFCNCRPGFEGKTCERRIDRCASNPCDATGTSQCENGHDVYRCSCNPGFTGDRCQTAMDPCLQEPCNAEGTSRCISVQTSFQCECKAGFKGSICQIDIDECASLPCQNGGTCMDMVNGFTCVCEEIYFGELCEQAVDDCRSKGCNEHGRCAASETGQGMFSCVCDEGLTGPDCDIDIDECALSPPCEHNCTNTLGSFRCFCQAGYLVDIPDLNACRDIDECQGSHGCDSACVNSPGSFKCTCEPGYQVDTAFKRYCVDINECRTNNGGCAAKCINNEGSFACYCFKGYESRDDGRTCHDIDECTVHHGCQYNCINAPGSYKCSCPEGFLINYDKKTCRDVNECFLSDPPCDQKCSNSPGSYKCSCNKGYIRDEELNSCEDIDECAKKPCSDSCVNTDGSFRCECDAGFEIIGTKCFNMNECRSNPCQNGRCLDGINQFSCSCYYGYSGDLCEVHGDVCSSNPCVNGQCQAVEETYSCNCDPGYSGQDCDLDINECEHNNGNCSDVCQNTEGSFICVCGEGFTSMGAMCLDVDECLIADQCEHNCTNTIGSFRCSCQDGYSGEPPNCVDIDECSIQQTHQCQQNCVNTPGSFHCGCSSGFRLNGDGMACTRLAPVDTVEPVEPLAPVTPVTPLVSCSGSRNVSFSGHKHLLLGARSDDYITIKFAKKSRKKFFFTVRLRGWSRDGVIMALDGGEERNYTYVFIRDGLIAYEYRADQYAETWTQSPSDLPDLGDGAWHEVALRMSAKNLRLIVDGKTVYRGVKPGYKALPKGTEIYIGGVPTNRTFMGIQGLDPHFKGCMSHLKLKAGKISWLPSRRKVERDHSGCLKSPDNSGAYFYGTGYAVFGADQYGQHRDLTVRTHLRSSYSEGLILFGSTQNGGSYSLALEAGKLVAKVLDISGDVIQLAEYYNGDNPLCDGLWMTVYCKMSKEKITMYVNGKRSQVVRPGAKVQFNSGSEISIGGIKDSPSTPRFHGSIKNMKINNVAIEMQRSRDYLGVNVFSIPI